MSARGLRSLIKPSDFAASGVLTRSLSPLDRLLPGYRISGSGTEAEPEPGMTDGRERGTACAIDMLRM